MKYWLKALVISVLGFSISYAQVPADKQKYKHEPSATMSSWIKSITQGFNMRVCMSNEMIMGSAIALRGGSSNPIGLEYPAGSGVEHLYSLVPYIGMIMDGKYKICEGFNGYDPAVDLPPERIVIIPHFWRTVKDGNQYDSLGYRGYYYNNRIATNRRYIDDDHDGKIDEDELDGMDNDGDWNPLRDDVGEDGLPDYFEVSCNGVPYDSVNNPDPAYDNYEPAKYDSCHSGYTRDRLKNDKILYTEKNGLPDNGEPHVDEDYGAISDNDIYSSGTDTLRRYMQTLNPAGAKLFLKSYAWKDSPNDAFLLFEYNFINIGAKVWNYVYFSYFADMDVGPVSTTGYYEHNYAAFDSVTRTAYISNPVDSGATPLGMSLLHTTNSSTTMKLIFQWYDYQHLLTGCSGSGDSATYCFLSGQGLFGDLIMPNQSQDSLSDTRLFLSFGPFTRVNPGDTVRAVIALVSGNDVNSMLNNAVIAKGIYDNDYLLDIHKIDNAIPAKFGLSQNYPNPFNPTTMIRFEIVDSRFTTLKVYDVLGREVETLVNEVMNPGTYSVKWDASGSGGLSSGVYFYRLQAGKFSNIKKMLLVR